MAHEFCCRVCHAQSYVAIGRSRLGAKFYACVRCSVVFMAPEQFSKAQHEQLTPTIGHLFARKRNGER